MIKFTQSMQRWLIKYHQELVAPLLLGHLEKFTDEHMRDYLAWCHTDEGRSYLRGGCNYIENYQDDEGGLKC